MILASILITSGGKLPAKMPRIVQENIVSFKRHHADLDHRLFGGDEIRDFVQTNFGHEVGAALDTLRPFAYKADLARYCIMHHFGGVYADLSYLFVRAWKPIPNTISVFRDFFSSTPWDTSNGLFAAPPQHKALQKAIELVCANVKRKYYGPSPLCPTGPTLFGKALALTCEPEEINSGEAIWIARKEVNAIRTHGLSASGSLVAIKRKKGGGPMTQLGIDNGNSYRGFWSARDVYATSAAEMTSGSASNA